MPDQLDSDLKVSPTDVLRRVAGRQGGSGDSAVQSSTSLSSKTLLSISTLSQSHSHIIASDLSDNHFPYYSIILTFSNVLILPKYCRKPKVDNLGWMGKMRLRIYKLQHLVRMFLIVGVKNLYAQGRANENQQNRTTDRPFLTHFVTPSVRGHSDPWSKK